MWTSRRFVGALLVVAWPLGAAAQNGTVMPQPRVQFFDNAGAPCAACTLRTYEAGTTTNLATYSEVTLTTANANPVVLDSAGRAVIYLSANSYRFILTTAAGAQLWDQDNVAATHAGLSGVSSTTDLTFQVDSDNNGTNVFNFNDGAGTTRVTISETGDLQLDDDLTIGDATAADHDLVYDGNAQDFYVCLDDSVDDLVLGVGNVCGTTPTLSFDASQRVSGPNVPKPCEGRLTLTTATPVTTADVTNAATLYFTPYQGETCALYDGTAQWVLHSFAELSLALGTCCTTASRPYDIFFDWNDGTPALAGVAWTNDTTRATALTTQDGVYVLTADTQRRYLGTIYIDATGGETNDSFALRHVWNYYNRVPRLMRVLEATNTWSYTIGTLRQANGSTANQLDFIIGVAGVALHASVYGAVSNSAASVDVVIGIGLDSTSALATGCIAPYQTTLVANETIALRAQLVTYPAIGRHYVAWLEYSEATGTSTWQGDGGIPTLAQSGIQGSIDG